MRDYQDIHYQAPDGLALYARDYGPADAPFTILCMHGLTRNSADFHELACHLSGTYRVIAADQRGRGLSAYDSDPEKYTPITYVGDMMALLSHQMLDRVALIGTSMGGIMAMMMTAMAPERVIGAVINDIGPVIDPRGLARIKGYVGKAVPVTTWAEAAAGSKALNGAMLPDYADDDWMRMARKTYREDDAGLPVLAYDPAIAIPFAAADNAAAAPDLWPAFETMNGTPTLVIRGENSDILSADTAIAMTERIANCSLAVVPNRGHAPMLDEPEATAAIDEFLAGLK